jgi:hypothetical protein
MNRSLSPLPKKVVKVVEHYNNCFAKDCMHCIDCIAFALIYSEALNLKIPCNFTPYVIGPGHAWNFVKFLGSSISREYLPCDRALPYKQVKDFAFSLLRLPIETRKLARFSLIAHTEFLDSKYSDGIAVCR